VKRSALTAGRRGARPASPRTARSPVTSEVGDVPLAACRSPTSLIDARRCAEGQSCAGGSPSTSRTPASSPPNVKAWEPWLRRREADTIVRTGLAGAGPAYAEADPAGHRRRRRAPPCDVRRARGARAERCGADGGPIRRNNVASRVQAPAAEVAGAPCRLSRARPARLGATIAARHGGTTKKLMRHLGQASPAAGAAPRTRRRETTRHSCRGHRYGAEAIRRHDV
jgi:hypothetical protein